MNILLHEWRSYRKSFVIWSVSILAISVIFLSLYPIIARDAEYFIKIIEGYDEAIIKSIGVRIDLITSELGYYSFVLTYISLATAIQAMNLGISVLSKEVTEKTADFLLTKPISRTRIMTFKLLGVLAILLATFIIAIGTSLIMLYAVKVQSFSFHIFLMLSLTVLFIQLMFLAIGIFLGTVLKKVRSVISVSLGVTFTFFTIAALGETSGSKPLRFLAPFKYFNVMEIVETGRYDVLFVILSVLLVAALLLVSYVVYRQKDIHAL